MKRAITCSKTKHSNHWKMLDCIWLTIWPAVQAPCGLMDSCSSVWFWVCGHRRRQTSNISPVHLVHRWRRDNGFDDAVTWSRKHRINTRKRYLPQKKHQIQGWFYATWRSGVHWHLVIDIFGGQVHTLLRSLRLRRIFKLRTWMLFCVYQCRHQLYAMREKMFYFLRAKLLNLIYVNKYCKIKVEVEMPLFYVACNLYLGLGRRGLRI